MCLNVSAQTVIQGGYVSGNWGIAGSPYLVDGNLLVHPDSALEIGPGTEILFRGEFRLEVLGQLLVNGTPSQPVIFDRENENFDWRGIYFNTTDTSLTDSSILVYGTIGNCYGGSGLTIISSGRVRISAFTIKNCTSFQGAAIRCVESGPLFEDLQVENNASLDGAGIALDASDAILRNCLFLNNSADGAGGGIVIFNGSSPLLDHCSFSGNSSFGSGGGVYINDSSPVFTGCTFIDNAGAQGGGSLYSGGAVSVKLGANPRFVNCIFSRNISNSNGGAIASFSPNEIVNCLFTENTAPVSGGALFLSSGNPIETRLINNTFNENSSPDGAVLYAHNHQAVMKNCIAWQEDIPDTSSLICLDAVMALEALDVSFTDLKNGQNGIELTGNASYHWGSGNISLDPRFLPGSCDLDWQSPCIEAGSPDTNGLGLPATDLAGLPRIMNSRVDMGAYEYQLPLEIPDSDPNIGQNFIFFPNPASDRIYLKCNEKIDRASVRIYSINGQFMKEEELTMPVLHTIDLRALNSGIYVLSVSGGGAYMASSILLIL